MSNSTCFLPIFMNICRNFTYFVVSWYIKTRCGVCIFSRKQCHARTYFCSTIFWWKHNCNTQKSKYSIRIWNLFVNTWTSGTLFFTQHIGLWCRLRGWLYRRMLRCCSRKSLRSRFPRSLFCAFFGTLNTTSAQGCSFFSVVSRCPGSPFLDCCRDIRERWECHTFLVLMGLDVHPAVAGQAYSYFLYVLRLVPSPSFLTSSFFWLYRLF